MLTVEPRRLSGKRDAYAESKQAPAAMAARYAHVHLDHGLRRCRVRAAAVCYDDNNPFATSVFILAVVLVSRFTTGYWPGILASAVGVVSVNYLFTYPFHEFNLTIDGYPLTFAVMLVVSVLVSTLTTQIKRQEQLRYEAERDRMRANLLRSVSHDIRTPLTAIMGLSATVEESETLTDEGRGMVEEIHQNAQWLLHLSENILSVTRFCDEGVVIEKSDEVVEEIVGSEIIRSVRAWSRMPIIIISARSAEIDKASALDMGADDYLTKPFGTVELLARIRTALRHTRTDGTSDGLAMTGEYHVGDLCIDYNKHRVFLAGEDTHLTPNEYKIVALLGRHAGQVLTYKSMMKELWGPGVGGDNKLLRVHMANIRRKIEPNPVEPQYIFTEVGVGYRMADSH